MARGGTGAGARREPARPAEEPGAGDHGFGRRLVLWPLLALVVLAPLPMGGEFAAGGAALAVAAGALLALWAGAVALGLEPVRVPVRAVAWTVGPFALVLVWIGVQAAGWTPSAWHHPLWAEAEAALGAAGTAPEVVSRIALDPHAAGTTALRLLAYGAVFWLALQSGRDRRAAATMLAVFVGATAVYAAYGLAMEFAGAPYILWIEKEKYRDVVTATLRNRNNFATLAGLGLVAASGLLWHRLGGSEGGAGLRRRLRRLIEGLGRHAWLLVAWVVMFTALVLTESRAGFAATLIGLAVLAGLLAAASSRRRRAAWAVAGAGLAAAVALFALSGEGLSDRLARTLEDSESRLSLYAEARRAIGDAPVEGMGAGSYPQVFHLYRTPEDAHLPPALKAHNTYLENAVELGVPAAAVLTLAVLAAAVGCAAGVFRRRRDRGFAAVAVAGSALVGAHALVDFSLQIPAVAMAWCFLLGLGRAQSWSSRRGVG